MSQQQPRHHQIPQANTAPQQQVQQHPRQLCQVVCPLCWRARHSFRPGGSCSFKQSSRAAGAVVTRLRERNQEVCHGPVASSVLGVHRI